MVDSSEYLGKCLVEIHCATILDVVAGTKIQHNRLNWTILGIIVWWFYIFSKCHWYYSILIYLLHISTVQIYWNCRQSRFPFQLTGYLLCNSRRESAKNSSSSFCLSISEKSDSSFLYKLVIKITCTMQYAGSLP